MARKTGKSEFDGLYQGVEEKHPGIGVAYTRKGHYSVFIRMTNPVQQYSADIDRYYEAMALFENIVKLLGEGYTMQKQDVFSKQLFDPKLPKDAKFLSRAYADFFRGREYTEVQTYLIITQEVKTSTFGTYNVKKEKDFWNKIQKVLDVLAQKKVSFHTLGAGEISEYLHRYLGVSFRKGQFSFENFKSCEDHVSMGSRCFRMIDLIDIDEVMLPAIIKPYTVRDEYPMDLFAFLSDVPDVDCIIYTQTILIPSQRKETAKLTTNMNRKMSIKSAANQLAADDIRRLMDDIASEAKMLVYANYSVMLVVRGTPDKLDKPFNFIEKQFYDLGISINKCAYNQMELYINNFPGNAYSFKDYEKFLCPHDAAVCMMYKEHSKTDEETDCPVSYTNRYGVPVVVDFTGKEGPVKLTTNSNLFAVGPSGSGKSFHMNSVVRQLHDNGTDVVMVDTGNSYEGLCDYFKGTYIAYTEEKPITMNPFRITKAENNIEKRNFLKSLILLIWKGADAEVDKVSAQLIDTTICRYFDAYFTPFTGYTDEQKEQIRTVLMLEQKAGAGKDARKIRQAKEEKRHALETYLKLEQLELKGDGGEKKNAAVVKKGYLDTLQKLNVTASEIERFREYKEKGREEVWFEEQEENIYIENQIVKFERRMQDIRVESLSFNTFFEFALQFIPLECELNHIKFDMETFAYTLKPFYKGGEREKTLNDDFNKSLFEQSFIVFEIDAIKDDPVLFPIVTLIIMDVFIQKMRLKKNRKALIIEEAWKAIASPVMAEYIKYLYKTVRKFWGIVGVVTQELDDIISNETVKQTIINNSEITIMLDQSKFKDNFGEIRKLLSLNDVECHKIWSINNLDNHENRAYFKEVYIRRGQVGEVFGCEESPESYMAYTTERVEKDALKLYVKRYGSYESGIEQFCADQAQLFPKFTKADKWAGRINAALRLYTADAGDERTGEERFIRDWHTYDSIYTKALKKQIFPEMVYRSGQVWEGK